MKIIFYQKKRELFYSVHILFNIIRKKLPDSIEQKVLYFSLQNLSGLKKIQHIFSVSKAESADIHHIVEEISYAALFMEKKRTIITIHDVMPLYKSDGFRKLFFKWVWFKLPIARAGYVTTVSNMTKNEIVKYVGCQPSKIRVIYNCISPNFKPTPKVFNKEKPVILQIGTKPSKNIIRVINALKGISCKLNIVGRLSDEILSLLHQLNIDYTCKQDISEQEIIQQYIDCDMVVFASLFEGFGVPVVEANTIGRPVVTSNCSALPEIAGEGACLVDPLNITSIRTGILRVINDDVYRDNLIEAGRINSIRFDANTITNQYLKLYNEVYHNNNLGR